MKNGTLIQTIRKNNEWVKFEIGNGREFKILLREHQSGNSKLISAVIKCPKDIKISKEPNEDYEKYK